MTAARFYLEWHGLPVPKTFGHREVTAKTRLNSTTRKKGAIRRKKTSHKVGAQKKQERGKKRLSVMLTLEWPNYRGLVGDASTEIEAV